jgi:hypothetical protein
LPVILSVAKYLLRALQERLTTHHQEKQILRRCASQNDEARDPAVLPSAPH